jgi:hypothetical protein
MNYWLECVAEALEDAGIAASPEQIAKVAEWVEGAHDNYGMAHGHDCIPNPLREEIKVLQKDLRLERSKRACKDCNGTGQWVSHGPHHSAYSQCSTCRGEGKVA